MLTFLIFNNSKHHRKMNQKKKIKIIEIIYKKIRDIEKRQSFV